MHDIAAQRMSLFIALVLVNLTTQYASFRSSQVSGCTALEGSDLGSPGGRSSAVELWNNRLDMMQQASQMSAQPEPPWSALVRRIVPFGDFNPSRRELTRMTVRRPSLPLW